MKDICSLTCFQIDALGCPFPAISMNKDYNFDVKEIVIRSCYDYQFLQSDYILEIAIYRSWTRDEWKQSPKPAPKVESSITMYHPFWDFEMVETKNTAKIRTWDKELNCFFPVPEDAGGETSAWKGGLQGLLYEARAIKEMLLIASIF